MRKGALLPAALAAVLLAGCGPEVRTTYYADGQTWSEIRYRDGLPDGLWTTFWPNGGLKSEARYEEGVPHGEWRTWFENETPQTEQAYLDGRPEGRWRHWYDNGRLLSEGVYVRGAKDGQWREWYGDGTLKAEAHFAEGDETGSATVYGTNGKPKNRIDYKDGIPVFQVFWWESGIKLAEGPVKDDKRNGDWTVWNPDGTLNEEHTGTYVNDQLVSDSEPEGS
ncbi:MAG: toxin-antitoxin system YwqK family antitoxin [Planctomycetota bacterium]